MKIDRLIGILAVLLQKETVKAPYLAERFEVSRRTINRDIENLCKAGIPIVTRQGVNGGISIMEDYAINRSVFTNSEMQDILAGLRSLDSVNGTNRYGQLMEKLSVGSSDFVSGSQFMLIDLSSWFKDSLAPKIELIRTAIENGRELTFCYFSAKGESTRNVEPYYLIFRWSSWYVWGWCKGSGDFRLFKLNRMEGLQVSDTFFPKRQVSMPDLRNERIFPGGIKVKALFDADCKWRLVEEFGMDCFVEQPDGKLLFHADYTHEENLISWLLTFGDKAELIEPKDLRLKLLYIIQGMNRKYDSLNE